MTHICYGQNHTSLNVQNRYAQPTHQLRMESDMESKIRNYVITCCGCDLNKAHHAESETQSSCRTKKRGYNSMLLGWTWSVRVSLLIINR